MHVEAMNAMQGCPDIDGVVVTMIQRLDEPQHRLEMIPALLEFAGPNLQMGGVFFVSDNPKLDALKDKAREAVGRAADVETVTKALASPNLRLQRWAVGQFANPLGRTEEWAALLPQIEKAAAGENSDLRQDAVRPLAHFPGTERFLDERFACEKSPLILMGLLHERDIYGEAFNSRFLPRFIHLLNDPDESVRDDALGYIWDTYSWAEVYRLPFGRDVFDLVIKATQSKSAKERSAACSALTYLRPLDSDLSRETFCRLAHDPDENVRSVIAMGLADQCDRQDVKQAIAALVKDKSPVVVFDTILAIGPEKFLPQLQELARGPNAQIAESASDQLKQIVERSQAPGDSLR